MTPNVIPSFPPLGIKTAPRKAEPHGPHRPARPATAADVDAAVAEPAVGREAVGRDAADRGLTMHIAELWRYPVKSMAGERLQETAVGIDGIPGDRVLYVVDARGEILSARTRPLLLRHHATLDDDGDVLVDGRPWNSAEIAAAVEAAAGPGARLVPATGPERFDILPLLVATDGAIAAFGRDHRRLRPNVVLAGVPGLAERMWEGRQVAIGDVVIVLADLRGRCIVTTWDPATGTQDVNVLRQIRAEFGGTLALNAWAGRPGTIAVGDDAELLDAAVGVELPLVGRFA
jgi:uncharacterized protein YcbX